MVQREIRYFFPLHYDAGNRGCEAIAKGICKYLGVTFKAKQKPKPTNTGATIYRVQVGSYTKKENAENMLAKLKKDGYSGFIVEGKL